MNAQMEQRLIHAGMNASDIAWFDSFGCDDANVPVPHVVEIPDYRRREAALNRTIAALTFSERGEAREGRLAAAIGARVADALDQAEGVEEE